MAYTKAGRIGPKFVGGGGYAGKDASIYLAGTNTLATLYTSAAKSDTVANPTTLDSKGLLTFYAVPGVYDVRVGQNVTRVTVHPDSSERAPTDLAGFLGSASPEMDTLAEIGQADAISYDNSTSNLEAETVQAAVDELASAIAAL